MSENRGTIGGKPNEQSSTKLQVDNAASQKPEVLGNANIKKNGDIFQYVDAFMPGVRPKFQLYIECAKADGLIIPLDAPLMQWTLTNKDLAQWIIDTSDDLGLYDVAKDKRRHYWSIRFARLFLSRKGKPIAAVDIRHYISEINHQIGDKEVRNIDRLNAVRKKARAEVENRYPYRE